MPNKVVQSVAPSRVTDEPLQSNIEVSENNPVGGEFSKDGEFCWIYSALTLQVFERNPRLNTLAEQSSPLCTWEFFTTEGTEVI